MCHFCPDEFFALLALFGGGRLIANRAHSWWVTRKVAKNHQCHLDEVQAPAAEKKEV